MGSVRGAAPEHSPSFVLRLCTAENGLYTIALPFCRLERIDGSGFHPAQAEQKASQHQDRAAQVGIIKVYVEDKTGPDRANDATQAHKGITQTHGGTLAALGLLGDQCKSGRPQQGF